jgi:hypothetical protein
LRASVGSTEVSASLPACFGVIGAKQGNFGERLLDSSAIGLHDIGDD